MRICFYCDSVFSFGGVQRVLAEIAKGLSGKHEVTILTSDDPMAEDREMYGFSRTSVRFRYIRYPRLPFYEYYPCKAYSLLYKKVLPQTKWLTRLYTFSSFPGTYRRLLVDVLKEGDYDVIVGVHVYPSFYLAAVKKYLRAKVIGWLHNSYDAFFNHPGQWLWKAEQRFSYQMRVLDQVVVLTYTDQAIYRERMGLQMKVIYNPLTVKPCGRGGAEHRKFLSVGRLVPKHKGFDILISAFARLARGNREWILEIVGEGPEEAFLRSLIAEYQLEDRIFIYPFTEDIQSYYRNSSVYVLSSRWEGFGLVWLEAMAHGLPVIASDIPVIKEVFGHEPGALIFKSEDVDDLAQKMTDMVSKNDLSQMGEEACRFVGKFQLEQILKEWESLFV